MICKITKATIRDTKDPTVKIATNLVKDCFSNNCSSLETITVNSILQNAKPDMKYTYFDDARVSQAILENNITYVKEYLRKYKQILRPGGYIHLKTDSPVLYTFTKLVIEAYGLTLHEDSND